VVWELALDSLQAVAAISKATTTTHRFTR